MTIDINKVRVQLDSDDIIDHIELHANLKPILTTFLDRLEAAERERDWHADRCEDAMSECASLRARVEAMERQETARLVTPTAYRWRYRGAIKWQYGELTEEGARLAKEHNHEVQPLYALPGAKGEGEGK